MNIPAFIYNPAYIPAKGAVSALPVLNSAGRKFASA